MRNKPEEDGIPTGRRDDTNGAEPSRPDRATLRSTVSWYHYCSCRPFLGH